MELSFSDLSAVRDLYYRGLYRQAYQSAADFGPLREWRGPAARLMAGRLAIQLGAPKLGHRLHLAAFRESPTYLEGVYYHARHRLDRFGPDAALRFMRTQTDWSDAPPGLRADWLAVQALVYARINDFERAEKLLSEAEAGAVDRPWILVERSSVMELCERREEALEAARRALELQPWFRPAVQAVAHLLLKSGKADEAIAYLVEADQHLESGVTSAQLAAMLLDQRRPLDAIRALDRYEELSPLLEGDSLKWLAARRADTAYLLGRNRQAAIEAAKVGDDFYKDFATEVATLEDGLDAVHRNRILLPLDASYETTSPSALDLLCRFHAVPVPPTSLDPAPATDGLPDASERRRLNDAGWVTREFTLNPETTFELMQRGLPFLVSLIETGFGQARIVIGMDRTRGSLFFLEGSERTPGEAPFDVLLKRYKTFGPRCVVAVPKTKASALDNLVLPDDAAYDDLHQLQGLLAERRSEDAWARLHAIRATRPSERLTKFAALAYARGTAHTVLLADAAADLLKDFPNDSTMTLILAGSHRDLGRMTERRAVLQAAVDAGNADPLVMQSLGQMMLSDPAERSAAEILLRRSIRLRPFGAPGYYLRGILRADELKFTESLDCYRFAACLDDREEQFSDMYTKQARAHGRSGEVVRFHQYRIRKTTVPPAASAKALFHALNDRNDAEFAWSALDKAIADCRGLFDSKDDEAARLSLGELLVFRAEHHANHGRIQAAEADLAAAEPSISPALFHRITGRLARMKPDYRAALEAMRKLLPLEPLSVDNHRLLTGLLTDVEGRPAAKRHLTEWAALLPRHYGLAKFHAEFLYSDHDDDTLAVTRKLLELCPHDAWAYRQLALIHADRKEHTDALLNCERAAQYEPKHQSHFACLAHALRRSDKPEAALAVFRDGLKLHPDHELAIYELIQLSRGIKEKKSALRFVAEVLHATPHTGDGLLAYFNCAVEIVDDPEDLERLLNEAELFLEERPDLWQTWSLVVQTLTNNQRVEEALTTAREACERFPLNGRTWVDRAITAKILEKDDERIESLEEAVLAVPGWVPAAKESATALIDADRREDAIAVLERLAVRASIDPTAHWLLAEALWDADRGREAVDRAKLAVRLDTYGDPRLESAWSAVQAWCDRLDSPNEAVEFARELTENRAGDPRAWLRYARCISEISQVSEILRALDRALDLDPTNIEAYDLKAERLAAVGRFDEALAAASPPVFPAETPLVLQGRAAWVEARRNNYNAAIPQMQALVAVDPEYLWGWQQLAEWYNDVGRPESYLEAANELNRLRPEHPTSLTMRGEARIQTGEREDGKADLRDALRIHPGYSPAAVLLFDACLADGEHRDARTALSVLQEHLTGPEVLVKQLQYAARTNDIPGALRSFREIARTTGDGPAMFMQMGLNELNLIDQGEQAAIILREAWESEDEEDDVNPWSAIFWLDSPDGEAADDDLKLAACDAVLKKRPEFVPAYDRRAEQLAAMERYDEALATCRATDPAPTALRGRAAWVEAQSGNKDKAIEMMSQVLQEEPDYSWGWRQLTYWQEDLGRHRECLEAADHLVRLNQNDPYAYAVRGEARRSLGDNRGAKDDFAKAFELDPGFQAAGLQLVTAQLDVDDLSGAAKALETLQKQGDGPHVRLRQLQLAVREGNLERSRTLFRTLLTDLSVNRSVLIDASNEFRTRKWEHEAAEELTTVAAGNDLTPAAAGLWVQDLLVLNKSQDVLDALPGLLERNAESGREAVFAYATAMNVVGRRDEAADMVQRYAAPLRQSDEYWAKSGAALLDAKKPELAAAWLSDWAERGDKAPWMLRPVFDAFLACNRDDDAEAVAEFAVDQDADDEDDEDVPDFLAWLALFAAIRGETDKADDFIDRVEPVGLPDGVRIIFTFAQCLITIQRAANRAATLAEVKIDLKTAVGSIAPNQTLPGTERWYRQTIARLAADVGTLSAKFWAWRQRLRTAFPGS